MIVRQTQLCVRNFILVRGIITFGVGLLLSAEARANASLDPTLCQALIKHRPSADVTYRGGVDVNGKAVVSADVESQTPLQMPRDLNIPITLNLAKALNLNTAIYPTNQLGAGTEAKLGTITMHGDQVLWNDHPLSDEQQDNLAVLCLNPK